MLPYLREIRNHAISKVRQPQWNVIVTVLLGKGVR